MAVENGSHTNEEVTVAGTLTVAPGTNRCNLTAVDNMHFPDYILRMKKTKGAQVENKPDGWSVQMQLGFRTGAGFPLNTNYPPL